MTVSPLLRNYPFMMLRASLAARSSSTAMPSIFDFIANTKCRADANQEL